jgi:hypothetical protein
MRFAPHEVCSFKAFYAFCATYLVALYPLYIQKGGEITAGDGAKANVGGINTILYHIGGAV